MADLLTLEGLLIRSRAQTLVEDVNLSLRTGELAGLVGASGSGKTLTCRSLLGMVDLHPGVVEGVLTLHTDAGPVRPYEGVLGLRRRQRDRAFRQVRGPLIGYLPQQAQSALDPLRRVGRQVRSAQKDPRANPSVWLVKAGFPEADADRVAELFPHQLSGGMAQRVAIAQVLATGSRFLVADEPTTGLDATIQRRLVKQLRDLADKGLGVLMVTHDLRLLSPVANRVHLMDDGRITETWTSEQFVDGEPDTDAGRKLLEAARRRSW